MSSPLRAEMLERQAEYQRTLLETHVAELRQNVKDRVYNVKERFDVSRNVRRHVWTVAGVVAVLGLALGYTVTGAFTRW